MEEDLTHVSQYFRPVHFALYCSQLSSTVAHSYWQVEYIITGVGLLSASKLVGCSFGAMTNRAFPF